MENPAERALGRLRSQLEYMTIADIFETGLHEFINTLQEQLNGVGQSIFNAYFALEPAVEAVEEIKPISSIQTQTQTQTQTAIGS